jgi:GNAT superfamily N-acetyltransferase
VVEAEIRSEPITGGAGEALCGALAAEVEERYAGIDDDIAAEHPEPPLGVAETSDPHGVFLVARIAGEPVACGAIRRVDAVTAEVKRMYTVAGARRFGLGATILRALEDHARVLGYARVILETGLRQPEAVAMYEAAGYARIEPYGPYRESPWSVCFGRDLA